MVEPELAFIDFEDLQDLAEEFITELTGRGARSLFGRAQSAGT